MLELRLVENGPSGKFVGKDELGEAIRENLDPTYVYPCCAAGMRRREFWGVLSMKGCWFMG